jgi:transcriptional regulator GlxA family with amidase domain
MRHVSILVPEAAATVSSVTLTYEVFQKTNAIASKKGSKPPFNVQLVGVKKSVTQVGCFSVRPEITTKELLSTDLIIIPAVNGLTSLALKENKPVLDWVMTQYHRGAEVASLCTGAFLLASTGLLTGKQCSTHWEVVNEFRNMFPKVYLVEDQIITDEIGLYTSGGALSSMNLLLYLIEKYHNRETAIHVAKSFAIDFDRNAQSPYMIFTGQRKHQDHEIKKAQALMENHVGEKMVVDKIATMVSIDRRNFDRRFKKATSLTPHAYWQRVKMEAAKKSFEVTRKHVNEVMYEVGYTDVKAFRAVFKKTTGLSPLEYKSKYNKK